MISEDMRKVIVEHFESLDFWAPIWVESAVVVIGSAAVGFDDELSDVDVKAYVPQLAYSSLHERYREAVSAGRLEAVNPHAFDYDEFPRMLIPGVDGHYQVEPFENLEAHVGEYDDVTMWLHGNSRVLHDPSGRYGRVQEQAQRYPPDVLREKARALFLKAYTAASNASNQLRRGDRPSVILTMTACVADLLRLCCLLEGRPFPFEKWLYRVAMRTQAGRDLEAEFDGFFLELGRPETRRIEPDAYERPGHRNADLEAFPLFTIWRRAKEYFRPRLPR